MEAEQLEFAPHSPKQNEAIWSDKPIIVCATGIQWGKTTVGSIKAMMAICKHSTPEDNFLVLAPTYKVMQQSTLPAFLKLMEGFGVFSKGDAIFQVHGGGTVYFRTATDPDSIVGVTNVRFVWGDEAGLFSLYFWENIQARAAFRRAQIVLTTSPYTLNWIYKELIRPKIKDPEARPDVHLIRARSDENPYFPRDYYEEKRLTMDPRRFEMMFGGEWDRFQGLVYDCFREDEHVIQSINLPPGTEFYAGVDWGTTHPFVISIRAVTPDGYHYLVGEHYETGLTVTDMVRIAQQKKKIFDIKAFYCDPSEPGYLLEFQRAGLTAVPADNDIGVGIDVQYSLFKQDRCFIFKGACEHTLDELETYRYPDDDDTKGPNVDIRERKPVKQDDHCMDAMRYCAMHTARHSKREPVIIPEGPRDVTKIQNHQKRIQALKRPKVKMWEEWT